MGQKTLENPNTIRSVPILVSCQNSSLQWEKLHSHIENQDKIHESLKDSLEPSGFINNVVAADG